MDCYDDYVCSEGLKNTNLLLIKLLYTVSGPFLKYQVEYKIFDDYDCD